MVGNGKALCEAITLAEELSEFPQECLRADRQSAIRQALSGGHPQTLQGALELEYRRGGQVVKTEATKGATQFSKGKGRHGSFQN